MKAWKNLVLKIDATINQAIEILDKHEAHIVLVVDSSNKLIGTITDGDVRRGILKGLTLSESVSDIMNTNPITGDESALDESIQTIMKQKYIRQLPIVDSQGRLCDIKILDEFTAQGKKPNPVMLMAGGLSTRLRPLTENLPKPMLKLGGKPILETILMSFINQGFEEFYISVNYLADSIEDYFEDGSKWGVKIEYLREQTKMGTAGPLSLLPKNITQSLIMMNSDLLTKIDFDRFLLFHQQKKCIATAGIREYAFQIPYGIVSVKNNCIVGIDEKPVKRYFANAGIYILEPEAIKLVPQEGYLDMPDLLKMLIEHQNEVSAYPIREYWLDIGKHADYERAHEDYAKHFVE